MRRLILTLFANLFIAGASHAKTHEADLIIYGPTSAGVIAAVQAVKMDKTVIVVGPDKHLGGLSAGGLGWTDSGKKETIGGLSRDFYHRIWKHYHETDAWKWQQPEEYGGRGQGSPAIDKQHRTMWIFEPSAAEKVFEDYVREFKIPVHRDEWLDRERGVGKTAGAITEIRMLSGATYRGKMFIDATYEGDLLAAAGVDYHVGREANAVYDEQWNGIQTGVLHHRHHFDAIPQKKRISPYVIPGDPSSGVLPRISTEPPGIKGEGDHRVQAYCYRMCLTDHPDNRIPFPKPEGYDPSQYQLLTRILDAGWKETFGKFDPIPNRKTDTNNHGPFSTDNIGMNYDYPEATYAEREKILEEHRRYQQGLLYFYANDPSVPEAIRNKMNTWGLPKDEFTDNGNWSHQIYVREARRMIGEYVMTEHDCFGTTETPDSVGMGSYTLDSHNVQRYITPEGYVQNEGDIGVHPGRPYEIAYGSLIPKKEQCRNLLVPICVSSSHIAFGSIRMEPVFMLLGQSAATAAAMSIDQGIAVQDLAYESLKKQLLADEQVLHFKGSATAHGGIDPEKLPGMVVDDSEANKSGAWESSHSLPSFVGKGYLHDGKAADGKASISYTFKIKHAGPYEVRIAYTASPNRATRIPVNIAGKTAYLNQQVKPPIDHTWVSLGNFEFPAGEQSVVISNDVDKGYVVADAVQLLPQNK